MNQNPQAPDSIRPDADALSSDAYIRYLAAKKSVDDRSLNRTVWQTLKACLPPSTRRKPLEVIEFGAGIGTMYDRVVEWGLAPHFRYTMVELNPDYLAAFWSRESPIHSDPIRTYRRRRHEKTEPVTNLGSGTVTTLCADLYDVVDSERHRERYDLIIAHAVMDLVDIAAVLSGFATMVRPGGLLYLSLIYDGRTELLPQRDPEFERELIDCYHGSMDRRATRGGPSGGSKAGRVMFGHLTRLGLPILAAGASDWVVYPQGGRYAAEEACFLESIIATIDRQLQRDNAVDPDRLAEWTAGRQAQVKAGELTFLAGNMDFLARRPSL